MNRIHIPSLEYDTPGGEMVAADAPDAEYLSGSDFVLDVVVDGQARAYPHNILWWHEIYNDRVGETVFSVTFCPLTGSGLVFDRQLQGEPVEFGVSGQLYNSNLVMYDRHNDSHWSQMLGVGVSGPNIGDQLELLPVVETTWDRWQQLYPDTKVVSDQTGHARRTLSRRAVLSVRPADPVRGQPFFFDDPWHRRYLADRRSRMDPARQRPRHDSGPAAEDPDHAIARGDGADSPGRGSVRPGCQQSCTDCGAPETRIGREVGRHP